MNDIPAEVFAKCRPMNDILEVYRRSLEIAMKGWRNGGEAPELSDLMRWTVSTWRRGWNEMSNLQIFNYGEIPVRAVLIDCEPWWVLADVCRVLNLSNPAMVAEKLDDGEKMTLSFTEGHSGQRGGAQKIIIVSESGLYTVIIRSI